MSIQDKLHRKIEEFKSLELAKNHLEKLEKRIKKNYAKLEKLSTILEKEYNDIEQLEKLSVRALFEKILGDKEAQLEQERQEYLQVALNYNECKKSIELLEFEKGILIKKLENYPETKSELHNLIRLREKSLSIEDKLAKQLINDINTEIDTTVAYKRELHEAIIIGLKIDKIFKKIISNLDKVVQWGQYTLDSPDVHIRKMTYINKAKENSYIVKQLLEEFEDELMDIYDDKNIYIQSSVKTFRHFIDSLFDNLISDWIILFKIQNSIYTIHQIKDKVVRILKSLQHELKQVEENFEMLLDKKNKIITELN